MEARVAGVAGVLFLLVSITLLLVWLTRYQEKETAAEVRRVRGLLQELAIKSPSGRFSEQPLPGVETFTPSACGFGTAYLMERGFHIDVAPFGDDMPPSAILIRLAPLPPRRWRIERLDMRHPFWFRNETKPEGERFAQLFPNAPSNLPLESRRALLRLSDRSYIKIADGMLTQCVFWPKGAPELRAVVSEAINLAEPLLEPAA